MMTHGELIQSEKKKSHVGCKHEIFETDHKGDTVTIVWVFVVILNVHVCLLPR